MEFRADINTECSDCLDNIYVGDVVAVHSGGVICETCYGKDKEEKTDL